MALTRREAVAALVAAGLLVVAALVWLFGPYGLLGSGVAIAAVTLFVFDIREEQRADSVAVSARSILRR